ncbi:MULTISPECIES: hypothetical protein [Levilactobacillus]|jgi:glutaredoxin-related protein|uniref:Uncharacterized protein n=1 Tax=Levilactobacillus brevis TaxID=1580 RepID=A0A2A3TUC4_LEVBR|nr:hypothetical protein [Levilactobacillus brevis]MBL3538039.1 hypothetical protein [Lactobacillus sp. GPR40-2]MBL3631196.1 hypothetical protein [Lactobacillus sp. GPB7-4]MCB5233579.1 hypothetical protein [Levilactobacillus brevis]MCT3588787.1 hypothetical protein [Levilactobacillus brevis]MCT3599448.1 hypothetical protein [Levilactobacillus brevis]
MMMRMPANNIENGRSNKDVQKANFKTAIYNSLNDTETIKKNLNDILSNKEVRRAVEKLSKV